MGGGIDLVQDDQRMLEMVATSYPSEELLQVLLADYPHLLAGDQIDSDNPRRWLLVSRELGLPDDEPGAIRWSVNDWLNRIPGVAIPEDRLTKYPSITLSLLTSPEALDQFLAVFDWVIEDVRNHGADGEVGA